MLFWRQETAKQLHRVVTHVEEARWRLDTVVATPHGSKKSAASNRNVPQQGIPSGTASERNKSESIMEERLLHKITPVCAMRKSTIHFQRTLASAAPKKIENGTVIGKKTSVESTSDAILAPRNCKAIASCRHAC